MGKQSKTSIEKLMGSLPTALVTTGIAYSSGGAALFLPVLTQALASGRHSSRTERAFEDINGKLKKYSDRLEKLSDNQYKLINEATLSILSTVNDEKITYLKSIILCAVSKEDISSKDVSFLSRVIRDISADEIRFLISNYSKYESIFLGEELDDKNQLYIPLGSDEELVVSGLINMGLLYSKRSPFGAVSYEFSPLVKKILDMLKADLNREEK